MSPSKEQREDLITLSVDGNAVSVPKGSNLIQAARACGVSIPHFCYHPDLSVVANCRICQVEVEGAPKLLPACQAVVQKDMVVRTHITSEKVREAQ
ncbi:2Fe-2S iron-sulfur cluster-binding protein, partial [Oligoflexia bacterium]|nr:2Fe-2S iron-sulfur cluster-binding protein [Oligoflexia bacterium]